MKKSADMVRRAIETCGLTRYELSKRTGVAESVLSRFVNHKHDMTLETLDKLAIEIGVRVVADSPRASQKGSKTKTKRKAK